jgi:hypothetical protein
LNKIDGWVFSRWQENARTFREFLSGLPGVYPSEVLCSLRRLQHRREIPEFDVLAVELDAATKPVLQRQPVGRERRYIEHPLDFEWHFTRQGVIRVCEEIENLRLAPGSEVLCLGCPTVYLIGKLRLSHLKFRLWDKNAPPSDQIEDAREISRTDISDVLPPFPSVAAVVIDPPWYREFYELFIWAGFNCLPLQGRMILSSPPEGTRPTASQEFSAMIKWCSDLGLKLDSRVQCCLPYRSPLFEVNALRAQGVSNVPLNWRRGDLVVLTKLSGGSFAKPRCSSLSKNWDEMRVRSSRIKIHHGKRLDGAIFRPAGEYDIIPSVSSAHSHRLSANVVTSGNRFFRTSVSDEVFECLTAIDAAGPDWMRKIFIASKRPLLMRKVVDFVQAEENEALQYFRRIHEI